MSVSALNSAADGASSAAAATTQKIVGKDEFLKLFVTQLKFQDPLNPMDSTGFTSQLAQFSSLEQLTNISDGMKSLLSSQNSLQNALITGMIGKRVGYAESYAADGTATMKYGTVTGVSFDSDKTWFVVDGATKVALGDIKEIQ